MRENVIEFLRDEERATVTFSQGRYKSKIRKLAEQYPDECQIVAENQDGSICAHIPTKWVAIRKPRRVDLTEEQRAERVKRLAELRNRNSDSEDDFDDLGDDEDIGE